MGEKYFLEWWFDYGRAMVREWGPGPDVWGIPRPYLRILTIGTIGLASRVSEWMTALEPKKRFISKCMVWKIAGQIVETRQQGRRRITERNAAAQKPGR